MPILSWELWLARDLVAQHHLPWQKPLSNLTPGRVAESIFLIPFHEKHDTYHQVRVIGSHHPFVSPLK